MELMPLPSRFSCLLPLRFSRSVSLARSMKGRLRLLVLVTSLAIPGVAIAQPPGLPPNPVKIPKLPGPMELKSSWTWQGVAGSTFETAHPYGNHLTTWKQVYLPAAATKLRLVTIGTFELENGYDFFEVWAFQNSAWVMVKRYTGTVGPSLAQEFVGQYFQLKLATDASTTRYGFKVSAEYRD